MTLVMWMNRLRDLREDRDLTQRQISEFLNCSQTTYSRYETGELNIPVDTLKKLAIYFNTSIDYITFLTDEKKSYRRSNKNK